MKIAIIFLGQRITRLDVPWINSENWDEVSKKVNAQPQVPGFKEEWKKVGNEYRIYITQTST